MSHILVWVEQQDGRCKKTSLPGLTFGRQLAKHTGGKVHAITLGPKSAQAAKELAAFDVDSVHWLDNANTAHSLAEGYAPLLSEAATTLGASRLVAVTSSASKDIFPRAAVKLQAAMASDVLAIIDGQTYTRPMWAGNVLADVRLSTAMQLCTVRGTDFGQPAAAKAPAPVAEFASKTQLPALRTTFVSSTPITSTRPDVATADRIVSAGRGIKGPEGFKIIEALADVLNAGVGASRAICDAGWVPNDLQIGQTGKVVAPNIYIAIGLSGAIQHLAGMKGSKVIVAINKDPQAPIFQVADYGLVADLFQAVPEMTESLKGMLH